MMFSPQVCFSSVPERLSAFTGPTSSNTMIGTARKVTTLHAAPNRLPISVPTMPNRSSIAWMTALIVACTSAHGRMRPAHDDATARPSFIVVGRPPSTWSEDATSPARKYVCTNASAMYPTTTITKVAALAV